MANTLKESLAEIKTKIPLEDYVSKKGVTLKEQGESYLGLCPFHSEKTPSFRINSSYQNYKCFGCGVSGDIVSYVMEESNLEFMEAVKYLAQEAGVLLPEKKGKQEEQPAVSRDTAKRMIVKAADFFFKSFRKLPEDHPAKKEIKSRGLEYKGDRVPYYGYCPGGNALLAYLREEGFKDEEIAEVKLCHQNKDNGSLFDMWPERLMFLITDSMGTPVGFSGKKLYENSYGGKYINSRDSLIFDKSKVLYNYSVAKKNRDKEKGEVFIVEGQFDVAAMLAEGLLNTVAASGTAFTEGHSQLVSRIADKNIFIFDGDKAGFEAALKVYTGLKTVQKNSYAVAMPEGQDPCDYRQDKGPGKLREYIETHKVPLSDFIIEGISKGYNYREDIVERNSFIEELSPIYYSSSQKEHFLNVLSLYIDLPRDILTKELESYKNTKRESLIQKDKESQKEKLRKDKKEALGLEDEKKSFLEFTDKLKRDRYFYTSVKALSFYVSRKATRGRVAELEEVAHKDALNLIKESAKIIESKKPLTPESFNNYSIAKLLLSEKFTPKALDTEGYAQKMKAVLDKERKKSEQEKKEKLLYSTIRNSKTTEEALEAIRTYGRK